MNNEEGLKIQHGQESNNDKHNIKIQGVLAVFVNCGSQYAIWRQFPQAIFYTLKDLDSGVVYNSVDMELSISEHGNEIYEFYQKEPCDRVVSQDFDILLNDIYFQEPSQTAIINFELQAEYLGHKSNILTFKEKSFSLKGFGVNRN